MYAWTKSIEPFTSKLQRWILGVPNIKPLSIVETEYGSDVTFSSEGIAYHSNLVPTLTHRSLFQTFQEIDAQLYFGITFSFLVGVLRSLEAFEPKSEAETEIYDASNFRRHLNRKTCGMTLKEFVTIVLEHKPVDQDVDFWVGKVISAMRGQIRKQLEFEEKYIPLRTELIRMFSMFKEEKKQYVSDALMDNPFIRIQTLGLSVGL